MKDNLIKIHQDKSPEICILYDAILETIEKHGLRLPLVTVIGTLDLIKMNLTVKTNEINDEK